MIINGIRTHVKKDCIKPCPFHAPSEHPLNKAPMHIRLDKVGLVERICEHGVGHDDPDSVAYMHKIGHKWAGVHGCDGCCTGTYNIVQNRNDDLSNPPKDVLTPLPGQVDIEEPTKQIRVDELLCDPCNMKRMASMVGQGFTDYVCKVCKNNISYSNTGTPKVCKPCAIENNLCQRCVRNIQIVFF